MKYPFAIGQMGISTILDHTFRIYRAKLGPIMLFTLLIGGGAEILTQLWSYFSGSYITNPLVGFFDSIASGLSPDDAYYYFSNDAFGMGQFYGLTLVILFLVSMIVRPFVTGGTITASSGYYHGKTENASENFKNASGQFPGFIALAFCNLLFFILAAIIISIPLGTVIFLVSLMAITTGPAIPVFVMIIVVLLTAFIFTLAMSVNSMSYAALVCEGKQGFSATMRAVKLTFSRTGKCFAVCFVLNVLLFVIGFVIALPFSLLPLSLNNSFLVSILQILTMTAVTAFAAPIFDIGVFLLYIDAKIKLEGYDLTLNADSLRTEPYGPSPFEPGAPAPAKNDHPAPPVVNLGKPASPGLPRSFGAAPTTWDAAKNQDAPEKRGDTENNPPEPRDTE